MRGLFQQTNDGPSAPQVPTVEPVKNHFRQGFSMRGQKLSKQQEHTRASQPVLKPPITRSIWHSVFQRIAIGIAGLTMVSVSALAKTEAGVEATLVQNRIVVGTDGKESLVPADKVKPGDVVEYQARYLNKGAAPVTNLVVTLPIPKGLELLAKGDLPTAALASIDGVKFEALPLKRMVRRADGTEVAQAIPLNEYRALRWQVAQLPAGKFSVFTARAKVENGASNTAASTTAMAPASTPASTSTNK